MKKIRIGQIGIGHNHGHEKMRAVQKFPELFEVVGYTEESEYWMKERGNLPAYAELTRYSEEELLEKCDYLVQATSLGLKSSDPLPLSEKYFHPGMKLRIFDTIYHPTAIQELAERLSLAWANGKEMLIRQGAESFRLWTGIEPDLDIMRKIQEKTSVRPGYYGKYAKCRSRREE